MDEVVGGRLRGEAAREALGNSQITQMERVFLSCRISAMYCGSRAWSVSRGETLSTARR